MSESELLESQGGFEYQGRFYPWHVSDIGKDLMLIDRICAMGLSEFLEAAAESNRTPVILTLVATSLRHAHPDWSVERIVRLIEGLSLSADITMVGEDKVEEASPVPLATRDGSEASRSPSNGSSSSPTPAASSESAVWSEIPS